jgi:branched-chain amino acid transport system permease protein
MFISAFLIAIAGAFYAQFFRYINPTRIFGLDMSIRIALIAVVGGQGKIFGPMIGAVILVPITELLSLYFGATLPGLHLFIYGVVMVLVVLFMPKGINDYVMTLFAWIEGLLFGKSRKADKTAQPNS